MSDKSPINKEESSADIAQLVLNTLLILGTLSGILYFSGYLYKVVYYVGIGVRAEFLDFSPNDYIITGFLQCLFLIPFLGIAVYCYRDIHALHKMWRKASKTREDVRSLPDDHLIERTFMMQEVNNSINEIDSLQESIIKFLKNQGVYLVGTILILNMIWIAATYKLDAPTKLLVLGVESTIDCALLCLVIFMAIKTLRSKVLLYYVAFFMLLFSVICITPIVHGVIDSNVFRKTHTTGSFMLQRRNNPQEEIVNYVYFGKENYFFIIQNKLIIVPFSEVVFLKEIN